MHETRSPDFPAACIRRATASLLASAVLATACFDAPPDPTPPVPDPLTHRSPPAGEIAGKLDLYESHAWLGIPYALSPVGELRWRAPRPPAPWPGVREAVEFGAPCTQFASPLGGDALGQPGSLVGDEDCLTLAIWAPRFSPDEVPVGDARLPVMVWIHGGGNSIGSAAFYHGGNLAASQRVVVVALNYRLGPFGWFRHASLRGAETTAADRSGNYGTLDLIRGLEWVRDNIAAFGGDPGNVTVFGESAGGRNVFSLLLSRRAGGLFHRAIAQSGGLDRVTGAQAENFADAGESGHTNSTNETLLDLLVADGTAPDREAAREHLLSLDDPGVAAYLRGKSAAEIMSSYDPGPETGMLDMPRVIADGYVLPRQPPLQRLASPSGYTRVPVMLGTTRDENKLFMYFDPNHVKQWFGFLPRVVDRERYEIVAEYRSRMWKAGGADEPARRMRAVQGPSVFAYRFDWDEGPSLPPLVDLGVLLGAAHGFEIPFVFGHWDLGPEGRILFTRWNRAGRSALSAQMMSYWAHFAYTGSPHRGRGGDLPEWTAWDDSSEAAPKFMILDTPDGGGLRMSSRAVRSADLIASVDTDRRLHSQRERCLIYWDFARPGGDLTRDEYAKAGRRGCGAYPFDGYPWEEE